MEKRLYKNKYCIGIYENNAEEQLIGLFDTPRELAKYLEISVERARSLVSYQTTKGKFFFIGSKIVTMVLIDVADE